MIQILKYIYILFDNHFLYFHLPSSFLSTFYAFKSPAWDVREKKISCLYCLRSAISCFVQQDQRSRSVVFLITSPILVEASHKGTRLKVNVEKQKPADPNRRDCNQREEKDRRKGEERGQKGRSLYGHGDGDLWFESEEGGGEGDESEEGDSAIPRRAMPENPRIAQEHRQRRRRRRR